MRPDVTRLVIAAGTIGLFALVSTCAMADAGAGTGVDAAEAARYADLSAFPWKEDLATARNAARTENKLVMCFQLLGDLTAPDC